MTEGGALVAPSRRFRGGSACPSYEYIHISVYWRGGRGAACQPAKFTLQAFSCREKKYTEVSYEGKEVHGRRRQVWARSTPLGQ